MTANGKTIYHVSFGDDANYYFGSLAAIFDRFTPSELGVSLSRLYCVAITPEKPYKNGKIVIRKSLLCRKKTHRKLPPRQDKQ